MSEDLTGRVVNLERRVADVETLTSVLRADVAEIKGILRSLATKDDLNGFFRDALAAVPAKYTMIWTTIGGISMIIGLVLSFLRLSGH